MLDTVKINHVQHISFTQSRLTDAVSVILSELLSYEHPSKGGSFLHIAAHFCRLYLSLIGKSDKINLLRWLRFSRLPGISGRKEVYDMCFKSSWLKALKISLDASVYRDLGFSEDESFSFALTDNSSSVKGAAAISPEKLRAIKEAGKKRERELAALEQRQRKTREENPWIYEEAEKFRQEAAQRREEARKKNR